MSAWQPIETVPEGEPVLLFDEEWEMTLGAIQIGHADGKGGFIAGECYEFNPTHWMPLPEPPLTGLAAENESEEHP